MQPRVTPALAQGQVRLCLGTGQGQQPGVPLLPPALQGGGTPAPSCPLGLTGGVWRTPWFLVATEVVSEFSVFQGFKLTKMVISTLISIQ